MGVMKSEKDYLTDEEYSDVLDRLYRMADELGVTFWLTFGTLLGYARGKTRIPWDNDIDIGTTSEGFDILQDNLEIVRKYGFFIREKTREPMMYRGLFIYDPTIQPFHVDISEFVIDGNGRYTFRVARRVSPPAKVFNYLNNILMAIGEFTHKDNSLPYKDSEGYKKLHQNKITNTIIRAIATADYYFTTIRELCMTVTHFAREEYYGVKVLVPMPVEEYCELNYGSSWKTPIKKKHPRSGCECIQYKTEEGVEICYL
jgi:hypothetical protein